MSLYVENERRYLLRRHVNRKFSILSSPFHSCLPLFREDRIQREKEDIKWKSFFIFQITKQSYFLDQAQIHRCKVIKFGMRELRVKSVLLSKGMRMPCPDKTFERKKNRLRCSIL